ncbi:MAG: ATP-grasp domain-containing protein [Eubacterium sp.]|nr:ATP-grasp domain-containing protein [Eubacterium sp.]
MEDGTWRVIEAGDGQVSGLSINQDYESFFRALSVLL